MNFFVFFDASILHKDTSQLLAKGILFVFDTVDLLEELSFRII